MGLAVSKKDGVTILALEGKIMGGPEAGEINDKIHLLIENEEKKLVIDMEKVDWMNSSGLGILIGAITTLRNNDGDLCLLHVSERVRNLFRITKLSDAFKMYDELDSALKAMQ